MSLVLSRRSLLALGSFGLGATAVPAAAQLASARGFTHSVASGEPGHYKVMLWTRYQPPGGRSARLNWQVSATEDFARVVASGETVAEAEHDWCVKPVAEGLEPGRWYYYRFRGATGASSDIGRTRTLPNSRSGPNSRFSLGVFSCANLPFGHFNAYGHAAARDDIDLVVHLGDYFYEYQRGTYPSPRQALPERVILPASETVQLADYRLRFASYRADRNLQALHRRFPMIAMWDDHETANDSWRDGAQNHQPAEGEWSARKRAATRVYREWMPVSDADSTSYRIGDLAQIFRPETRLRGRDQPLALGAAIAAALRSGVPLRETLTRFRDEQWLAEDRSMLGMAQEKWLADGLAGSVGSGVRWQVLAQQTVMGSVFLPTEAAGWTGAGVSEEARQRIHAGLAASGLGLPVNFDNWDGYPRARERLLRSARNAGANLVVLSGDSHNAWAFNLPLGKGEAAGVEFAGQSVTSPGFEGSLPMVKPDDLVAVTRRRNPALQWANFHQRGYMTVTLTPAAATSEWLFLDTVRQPSTAIASRHRMSVVHGTNRLQGS
jgi:alkaline phosphatase D